MLGSSEASWLGRALGMQIVARAATAAFRMATLPGCTNQRVGRYCDSCRQLMKASYLQLKYEVWALTAKWLHTKIKVAMANYKNWQFTGSNETPLYISLNPKKWVSLPDNATLLDNGRDWKRNWFSEIRWLFKRKQALQKTVTTMGRS